MPEANQTSIVGGTADYQRMNHSLLNSLIRNARILLLHCVHRSDRGQRG